MHTLSERKKEREKRRKREGIVKQFECLENALKILNSLSFYSDF